jgi:hypothetical protein
MKYSLWQKRDIWYASTYVKNKQYSISLRTKNRSIAQRRALPWLANIAPECTPTLTELLDFYLDYTPDRSERTEEMAADYMQEFIAYLGSNLHSSQVNRAVVIDYKKYLQSKYKYNTVKIKLGTIKAIINLAFKEEIIQDMPFKGIVIGKSRSKTLYLSRDEIQKLVNVAGKDKLYQGYIFVNRQNLSEFFYNKLRDTFVNSKLHFL